MNSVKYIIAVSVLLMNSSGLLADTLMDTLFNRSSVTGDWRGYHQSLVNKGVFFNVNYTSDYFANTQGGISNKSVYLDNTDITLSLNMETLANWNKTKFNFYVLGNNGGSPSELVGDIQTLSNIDAYDTWKLYEAWIQKELFQGKLSLLAGLYDVNSEFDSIDAGGLFLNSSHGIGPDYSQSGKNGPSIFPTTSLGLRIKVMPDERYYFQFALLDGVPGDPDKPDGTSIKFQKQEGLLLSSEWKYFFEKSNTSLLNATNVAVGGWYYTGEFEHVSAEEHVDDPISQRGNYGIYVLAEKKVLSRKNSPDQGLSIFTRFGFADPDVNQFRYYFGGGLVYDGLIPGRRDDQTGLAIATVNNSERFIASCFHDGESIDSYESSIELTHLFELPTFVSLQPNLQYIINPSMDKNVKNALAIGCRFNILF